MYQTSFEMMSDYINIYFHAKYEQSFRYEGVFNDDFILFLIETICCDPSSELSHEGVFDDNFILFLIETICCDPSSEPSHRDGSDEGSHHMFLWRINKNYP